MNPAYEPLFQPYVFPSGIETANRLAVAPMTTWSSNLNALIHDDEIPYIARRSRGIGMFMTAACYVHPDGHAFHGQWGCHTGDMLPSLERVAETIHAEGARAILQIHHGGRMCPASLLGKPPVSASAVPAIRPDADVPTEMSEDDILETIQAYADATRRAIAAGYDGVEIHGANTYLPQQFFSPHSNRRNDRWGGSLEKRLTFPRELTAAVIDAAASATRPFAVGYRFSPEEIEEPGITLEDSLVLVDLLADFPLDWLHVSTRDYFKGSLREKNDDRRPGKVVIDHLDGKISVISVGKVYTPEDAMTLLDDGCAVVALGRILLMEPEWMEKVQTGNEHTIRKTLPATGAAESLTLPKPLYKRLLDVKGWLPVEE